MSRETKDILIPFLSFWYLVGHPSFSTNNPTSLSKIVITLIGTASLDCRRWSSVRVGMITVWKSTKVSCSISICPVKMPMMPMYLNVLYWWLKWRPGCLKACCASSWRDRISRRVPSFEGRGIWRLWAIASRGKRSRSWRWESLVLHFLVLLHFKERSSGFACWAKIF